MAERIGGLSVEARFAVLKQELEAIESDGNGFWCRRKDYEDVRRCAWRGQSADGRKHREVLGEEPFPFEGAADNRVRLVDEVVNERAMLCAMAALRAPVHVRGFRSADDGFGKRMEAALKWIVRNVWRSEFVEWLMLLAQYREGDTPAAALAGVYWDRRDALRLRRMSLEEIKELYLASLVEDVEPERWPEIEEAALAMVAEFEALLGADAGDAEGKAAGDDVVALLGQMFPDVSEKRRRKAVAELRASMRRGDAEAGCEFPEPYVVMNGPRVVAHRVGEDVLVPLNMGRFQDVRHYFVIEWLPEWEVRQRVRSRGYKQAFVDKLLASEEGSESGTVRFVMEGKGVMRELVRSADGEIHEADANAYRGLFQVATGYFRGVDEDGVQGVFSMAFHPEVDVPATDAGLMDLPHNDYPGVWFQREFISKRALDSRGWPELLGATQSAVKDLADGFGNFATLTAVPTLVSKGRRSTARLKIGPLNELRLKPGGDLKALDMGRFPTTAVAQQERLLASADRYAGRGEVDAAGVALQREFCVLLFLSGVRDVLSQVLKLWQVFSTPEERAQVTGLKGEQVFVNPEDVEGDFALDVRFDPQDMDMDHLERKAKMFKDVLMPLDVSATIKWNVIVQSLFMAFDPDLAEAAVDSMEDAGRREVEDEEIVWLKALAGIETPPADGGQNFGARLEWLQQRMELVGQNPEAFGGVSPAAEELIGKRQQHLQFMVQQQENAQIGRVGV